MFERTVGWIKDYFQAARWLGHSFIFKVPPKHYLGHIVEGKDPIILIPGYLGKWNFLKMIADPLSRLGHPIYVLEHLGFNTKDIHKSAKIIRELIDEKKLKNVTFIAHSKGGLIGKHFLAFDNQDNAVKELIAVATPWGGSHAAKLFPHKTARELYPHSEAIRTLKHRSDVNDKIVSIIGFYDNHVWPTESCLLEGAKKNIKVDTYGHHTIIFNKKVVDLIVKEVEKI